VLTLGRHRRLARVQQFLEPALFVEIIDKLHCRDTVLCLNNPPDIARSRPWI
jgi:hypothetical protein